MTRGEGRVVVLRGLDPEMAALGHCVARVEAKVQEREFQLVGVDRDGWEVARHVDADLDGRAQAARRATVLLVDDEDLVRATTAESMRELGYDVVEANGAERALEAVRDGLAPDLVVTDLMMPGMTGADFAMVLRGQRPDLPILLITGYANLDPDRIRGLPVLAKPFRQAELATALSTLLPEG